MTAQMRIDIFSDTVCPWCFLGKRRFEIALDQRPNYEPRVTWRPFELNPAELDGGDWFAPDTVTQWVLTRPEELADAFRLIWRKLMTEGA